MIVRNRSFPYPVLAPFRDDISPSIFDVAVDVSSDAESHYLQVSYNYTNRTIADMVDSRRAVHVLHVECRRNFFRQTFRFATRSTRISLRAADVIGRVELSGFIVSEAPTDNYQVEGAHADYGAAAFSIDAGDVLAVARSLTFDAFVDYDPLTSVSSILTIERSETEDEGYAKLSLDSDHIVVTLSKSDYSRYTDLKGDPSVAALLANQVVVAVLVDALAQMKTASGNDHDDYMELRWYRSVYRKLLDNGVDIRASGTSPFDAVQLLLKGPIRRSLVGIISLASDEATP